MALPMQHIIDIILSQVKESVGYIDRGDTSGPDFLLGAFTIDAAWHNLDLTPIVTGSPRALLFNVLLNVTPGTPPSARFDASFHPLHGNSVNIHVLRPNINLFFQCLVAIDSNRLLAYNFDVVPWSQIALTISGWWL